MATRKSSSKPKLAVVPPIAAPAELTLDGDVYTIQGLADGARALVQGFYESHDNDTDRAPLLSAMRVLDVVDDRLDALGLRVEGLKGHEVVNG